MSPHSRSHVVRWPRVLLCALLECALLECALLGCVLLGLCAGCGHYDYVDDARARQAEATSAVSVWTVAASADEGIDTARLTRALVGALEARGVRARWQADDAATSLRCAVIETDVDGFSQMLFGRAEVRCRILKPGSSPHQLGATGRFTASTKLGAADLVAGHAQIQEAAALDALETVVDAIIRRGFGNE